MICIGRRSRRNRPEKKPFQLPDATLLVPMMYNLGTQEGFTVKEGRFAGNWPQNGPFYFEIRAKGRLIGVAVDPLTAHECGNQRYLAIPWLDACLKVRLPDTVGAPLKPKPILKADWLISSWSAMVSFTPHFLRQARTSLGDRSFRTYNTATPPRCRSFQSNSSKGPRR